MPNTVVFLWISGASLGPLPSAPPPEALLDLRDYGAARGASFQPAPAPRDGRPRGLLANDAAIVDGIEAELEQARTALSALEEGAAGARLSRVEGQLLAHPHLPQAAFLMGECLALQAQAARERSPALSAALDARRAELEGPRARAFGASPGEATTEPRATLPVRGLSDQDELELDGVQLGDARRVLVGPGLHHVRIVRQQRVVFAAFTEVVAEQRALDVPAPPLVPCSAEDLTAAVNSAPTSSVACPRWAQVRQEKSGIGVASCERERCGAFVHWQRRTPPPFAPLPGERSGVPAWLGFAIAGATVAAAGSLILWQAGAFDRSRPAAASWEYDGLNPQGLSF